MELESDQAKPPNMFRVATGLFHKNENSSKRMVLAEQLFKFRGGKVQYSIDGRLSHIFVDPDVFDIERFLIEYDLSREAIKQIRVVNFEWLIQSFNLGKKCNTKAFLLGT